MATALPFKSALDSLLERRDADYTRDMQFASALQKVKMDVAQEDRLRAGLSVTSAVANSQEQRMRDNQSATNRLNDLRLPLVAGQASRAGYIQQNVQPGLDAYRFATAGTKAGNAYYSELAKEAVTRQNTPLMEKLFGGKFKIENNRLMQAPTADGEFRDFLNGRIEGLQDLQDIGALEQQRGLNAMLPSLFGAATTAVEPTPVAAIPAAPVVSGAQPVGQRMEKVLPTATSTKAAPPIAAPKGPSFFDALTRRGLGSSIRDLYSIPPAAPGAPAPAPLDPVFLGPISSNGASSGEAIAALNSQIVELRGQKPVDYAAIVALQSQIDSMKNMA